MCEVAIAIGDGDGNNVADTMRVSTVACVGASTDAGCRFSEALQASATVATITDGARATRAGLTGVLLDFASDTVVAIFGTVCPEGTLVNTGGLASRPENGEATLDAVNELCDGCRNNGEEPRMTLTPVGKVREPGDASSPNDAHEF